MKKRYLVLATLFMLLFMPKNTFALDNILVEEPISLFLFNESDEEGTELLIDKFARPNILFYGYKFTGSYNRALLSYNYTLPNDFVGNYYNIDFVIYSELWTQFSSPYRVVLQDGNTGALNTCVVQSSSHVYYDFNSQDLPTSLFNTVSCSNAYISSTNFRVNIYDTFNSSLNAEFGISRLNFKPVDSKKVTDSIDKNTDEIKKQTEEQQKTNDILSDDNTDEANDKSSSFFSNFSSETHGLAGVITAPLQLLQSLTSAYCKPLKFNLPFVDNEVVLPCMKSIYEEHFGIFFSLWQMLTTGLISYNVCLNFYKKIRDLQNPNNDRIEVLNL